MRNTISLLLTMSLIGLLPCCATSVIDKGSERFFITLGDHIKTRLALDNLETTDVGKIQAGFDRNTGLIKKIKLLVSGISAQAEVSGLDAIITETPVSTNIQMPNLLDDYLVGDFKKTDIPVKRNGTLVKLHRIPLAVLDRYPGLFTSKELLADENAFSLKLHSNLTRQLMELREPWISFFRANSSATREQIIQLSKIH